MFMEQHTAVGNVWTADSLNFAVSIGPFLSAP